MDFLTDNNIRFSIDKNDQEKLINKLLGDWKAVANSPIIAGEMSHPKQETDFTTTIELIQKPKRLPRKLKKAIKNGKQWAIAYYQKKYPKYYFEGCTLEPVLADEPILVEDGMVEKFNINYYNSKHIKY